MVSHLREFSRKIKIGVHQKMERRDSAFVLVHTGAQKQDLIEQRHGGRGSSGSWPEPS